jgi:hypothetical protein
MPDFDLKSPIPVPVNIVTSPVMVSATAESINRPDRCEHCLFMRIGMGLSGAEYQCHRNPPVVVQVPTAPQDAPTVWPRILATQWCGEGRA